MVSYSLLQNEYLSSAVNVLTNSPKSLRITNRYISQLYFSPKVMKNLIKVLSCWFHKCLGLFNMLTVQECSEAGLFRHFFNHVFRSLQFGTYINYESCFSSNNLKSTVNFRNGAKNWENIFSFLDNCIWINYRKNSLLQKKCFPSRVNVLTMCLGPFNMLTVEVCSETGLSRHLSNHVFCYIKFREYISSEGHLFSKICKIWCRFEKWSNKSRKSVLFFR